MRLKSVKCNVLNVVTHDGVFHADDVFAVALLKIMYGYNIKVTRTRKPEILNDPCSDVVFDVGGGMFDHHKKETRQFHENGIIKSSVSLLLDDSTYSEDFKEYLRNGLFYGIDAQDNGQRPEDFGFQGQTWVRSFNPTWCENKDTFNKKFFLAVDIATAMLERQYMSWHALEKAKDELSKVKVFEGNPEVLILDRPFPWQGFITTSEDEDHKNAKFVVFEDYNGDWVLQSIPVVEGSFETRKPIPSEWSSLNRLSFDKKYDNIGFIFSHVGNWLAKFDNYKSLEQAITKLL